MRTAHLTCAFFDPIPHFRWWLRNHGLLEQRCQYAIICILDWISSSVCAYTEFDIVEIPCFAPFDPHRIKDWRSFSFCSPAETQHKKVRHC